MVSLEQLIQQLERNQRILTNIVEQQQQQQQTNVTMTEINDIVRSNSEILDNCRHDSDYDNDEHLATNASASGSATAVAATVTTAANRAIAGERKTLIDQFGMDVWASKILPTVSNLLSSESGDFENFYNNVPRQLQNAIARMVDDRTFLKPWKRGHLFCAFIYFEYHRWSEGFPYDRNQITRYSINCTYDRIALGDNTEGHVYLCDRHNAHDPLPLHEMIGRDTWATDDEGGTHDFCFDKQHPGVFIGCTYCDYNSKVRLVVFTDVSSIPNARTNSARPEYVIQPILSHRCYDWGIRSIVSTTGEPRYSDCRDETKDGKTISVRIHAIGAPEDWLYRSDWDDYFDCVVDVTVNLLNGAYTETLVKEFPVVSIDLSRDYSCGLSENGRYFWTGYGHHESTNQRDAIFVCDLEDNRNRSETVNVTWMHHALHRECSKTSVKIIDDRAFISISSKESNATEEEKMDETIIWDLRKDQIASLLDNEGQPIIGRPITCQCLSPNGKLLAVAWGDLSHLNNTVEKRKVEIFDWGTMARVGYIYEAEDNQEKITNIFFASSTADTICAIRESHAYIIPAWTF